MAKKSAVLEAPEEPKANPWPEVKESRSLPCKLGQAELSEKSDEMARHQLEVNNIEAAKKSANSHFKAKLDEKAAQLTGLAQAIADRAEYRSVKCEWRFEQAGFDSDRNPVFHPEQKTLVRLDTGEAVEVRPITDAERQMKLNLEDPSQSEAGEPVTYAELADKDGIDLS
jgi:hypothetical protein